MNKEDYTDYRLQKVKRNGTPNLLSPPSEINVQWFSSPSEKSSLTKDYIIVHYTKCIILSQ